MISKPESVNPKNYTHRLINGLEQYLKNHMRGLKNRLKYAFKSIFDKIVAGAIILTSFPLWLIIAVAIKLESEGPILLKEKRISNSGKSFDRYKFRSMYIDAEKRLSKLKKSNETDDLILKMFDDPRITKVGKFLRKHNLDELPQLINVLRFEMSLGDIMQTTKKEV